MLCALVGEAKGVQLFEADFNPTMPSPAQPQSQSQSSSSTSAMSTRYSSKLTPSRQNSESSSLLLLNSSSSLSGKSTRTNTLFADSMSSIDASSMANLSLKRRVFKDTSTTTAAAMLGRAVQSPSYDFNRHVNYVRSLGAVQLDINMALQLGGKHSWDEHFEYVIELRIVAANHNTPLYEQSQQSQQWCILRRYSKIRQLHEQMSLLYPSLTRLVFPLRLLFNGSGERQVSERILQLEHYLRSFIEIMLADPSSPICVAHHQSAASSSNGLVLSNTTMSESSNASNSSSSRQSPTMAGGSGAQLTRASLCSFCPFFEQTQMDLIYLSKLNSSASLSPSSPSLSSSSSLMSVAPTTPLPSPPLLSINSNTNNRE